MGWLFSIFLVVVALLATYPQVVQARPDAKQLLDRLLPYQGWIGVVAVIWGFLWGLRLLAHAGSEGLSPVIWLTSLAGCILAILLGLLLGYGLIAQYVLGNSPEFQRRGEEIRARLGRRQMPLGVAAIVVGVITFLMFLVM